MIAPDTQRLLTEDIRAAIGDPSHGIRHNGNDHKRGPLANCPRCVADHLLAERDTLKTALGESLERGARLGALYLKFGCHHPSCFCANNAHTADDCDCGLYSGNGDAYKALDALAALSSPPTEEGL